MPFSLHCWRFSICYRNFRWKHRELQLISFLNFRNRKTTKRYVKKTHFFSKCERRGWLGWLKLVKVCLLSSLLRLLKAAGHLNEILFSSLLLSLKPCGNLNGIRSHQRFVVQMCNVSAGLEEPDLCLVLKELSGVISYWHQELTIDSSASNTNNSNWSEFASRWPAIPISRLALILLLCY